MAATAAGNLDLDAFLTTSGRGDDTLATAGAVLHRIASDAIEVARIISLGQLGGGVSAAVGTGNPDGDAKKEVDVLANEMFIDSLRGCPVAAILSEELFCPLVLDPAAPLVVAIDPLDGSANIDTAVSAGTIFSILPAAIKATRPEEHFLRPGHDQIAAGFFIYGPQTSLALTFGDGVHIFTLDRDTRVFRLAIPKVSIPQDSAEYAINASNYRHWGDSVRAYVDDCVTGLEGPLAQDYKMHWVASLVAEAYRILARGGVFLYPADERRGYVAGRHCLICEANPISFLIEQAGGAATDTVQRILDLRPTELHARTPFVFGSSDVVHRIARYHTDPQFSAEREPLFTRRGLLRL
jgi:fructose-1,6-bisphosphatase I